MKLHEIQKSVRAAKDKRNDFGKYNYRNAEGILAELKSVLPDGWTVIGRDDVSEVGPHLFLRHTVTIFDADGKEVASSTGWAMHPEEKKGMDAAQITGACSSYAKKYALQNLLAVDDGSIDPDATNKHDDKLNMSFQEAATQHLSDEDLDRPVMVANAIADAIEQKLSTYKSADWAEKFMKGRGGEMAFILEHCPDRHTALRSSAWNKIQELRKGAA